MYTHAHHPPPPSPHCFAFHISLYNFAAAACVASSILDPMLANLPSYDPQNFSQFNPDDPSNPSKMTPITYISTNERTLPPPHQVIGRKEVKNILLRLIYQQAEEKLRPKRIAHDAAIPERASKVRRSSAC